MKDRRSAERFACDLRVEVRPESDPAFDARAIDISYRGICLRSERELPAGTTLELQLRLLLGDSESEALSLRGTIVWDSETQGAHQLGVLFSSELDDASWSRLHTLIRFLRGDLPLPPSFS